MADENRIGVVGNLTAAAAPPVPRGVPGVPQPPLPSAEEVQRVMAEQARQRQIDAAESQRRAAELARTAQVNPSSVNEFPRQRPQANGPAPTVDSQPNFQNQVLTVSKSRAQSMTTLTAPSTPVETIEKTFIPWFPIRSNGVNIELEDSIIKSIPERGFPGEGDAQAKVILALLSEILYLRENVKFLLERSEAPDRTLSDRVLRLEQVLFEQRSSLQSRARAVKEQISMLQAKGYSSEQIVEFLSEQSQAAAAKIESGEELDSE